MKNFLIMLTCLGLTGCITDSKQSTLYPSPTGYIVDDAVIIDTKSQARMEKSIEELKQKTSAEIAVVTINTTQPLSIEKYAANLFRRFGIGQKDKNNGVLILVAYKDRRVRIAVGPGLMGAVTDDLCTRIINTIMTPEFEQGNFSDGIEQATDAIINVITKSNVT